MNSKIVVILVYIVLVQGTPVDDTVTELNIQMGALKAEIGTIIQNNHQLIQQTRTNINLAVSQGITNLKQQLARVEALREQARAQGKLVDGSCPINVDITILNSCKINKELDLVGIKLRNLGMLKQNLNVDTCLAKFPLDVEGLRGCGKAEMDSTRLQVATIQEEISKTAASAAENSRNCVGGLVNQLGIQINEIETCISNLL